jgi:hypothetical protein
MNNPEQIAEKHLKELAKAGIHGVEVSNFIVCLEKTTNPYHSTEVPHYMPNAHPAVHKSFQKAYDEATRLAQANKQKFVVFAAVAAVAPAPQTLEVPV